MNAPDHPTNAEPSLPMPQLIAILFEQTLSRVMEFVADTGYDDLRATHFLNVFLHLQVEGRRSGELARMAGMTPQSMGELIDYLEDRGYVKRIPDPADSRAKLVVYAQRGFEASEKLVGFYREIESGWVAQLGPERGKHFRDSLVKLCVPAES